MKCYEIGVIIIILLCVFLLYKLFTTKKEYYRITTWILIAIGFIVLFIGEFPMKSKTALSEHFDNNEIAEQVRSLLVPENVHGTIGTQVGLDEWLENYMNENSQLRKSIMSLKLIGGGPIPNVTVSDDIIAPNGHSAIEVQPTLKRNAIENIFNETFKNRFSESFDNDKTNILLFYRPGCPWCEKLMVHGGDWDKFKNSVNSSISITEINTVENPQIASKFNVSGVPHIVKVKGDNVFIFNGDRTFENFMNFAN